MRREPAERMRETGRSIQVIALTAVVVVLGSLAWPGAALAQDACGPEARGGLWLSGEDVTVADGSPVGELDSSGLALALAAACDVADRFAAGIDLEGDFGNELSQLRTLLTGAVRITESDARAAGAWALSARGAAGWAFAVGGIGGGELVGVRSRADTLALTEDASGPALGAGLRAELGHTADLFVIVDAAWRAAFFQLTRFGTPDDARDPSETLHAFPDTAGVKLRLREPRAARRPTREGQGPGEVASRPARAGSGHRRLPRSESFRRVEGYS